MAEATKYYIGHIDDNLFLKRTISEFKEKQDIYRQRAETAITQIEKEYTEAVAGLWSRLHDFAQQNGRCPASFINQYKGRINIKTDSGCVFLETNDHGEGCPLCKLGIPH